MLTGEEDRPGSLLAGRYRLERIVGRGASAVVWEATHVVTGKTVALKIFGGDAGLAGDGKRRDRLLREARAASRSRHPHVLPIDDLLDLEDGRAALVMPLLVGRSLRDWLAREGKLSPERVRGLFAPALDGLARAHDAGVIHRDLKPDNLFVADDPPRLVILDFGVAKIAADGDLGLTSTGVTVGTPFYMAPEQLFGEDDVDARADVWALGVVLFECLRGERPTEATNLGQLLKRVSGGKVAQLTAEDLPTAPELVAIVNAMLSVDRDARPTLAEVRAALAAPVAETTPNDAPSAAGSTHPSAAAPSPRAEQPARRAPLLLAAVLVAGLAAALLGQRAATPAASISSSGNAPPASPPPSGSETVVSLAVSSAEPPASARLAPSTASPPLRLPPSPVPLSTSLPTASAKIVPAPPASAVSSTPLPPRIVEQAPF